MLGRRGPNLLYGAAGRGEPGGRGCEGRGSESRKGRCANCLLLVCVLLPRSPPTFSNWADPRLSPPAQVSSPAPSLASPRPHPCTPHTESRQAGRTGSAPRDLLGSSPAPPATAARPAACDAKMIIPVRCFTCGKVIGNKYSNYLKYLQVNEYEEGYVTHRAAPRRRALRHRRAARSNEPAIPRPRDRARPALLLRPTCPPAARRSPRSD